MLKNHIIRSNRVIFDILAPFKISFFSLHNPYNDGMKPAARFGFYAQPV